MRSRGGWPIGFSGDVPDAALRVLIPLVASSEIVNRVTKTSAGLPVLRRNPSPFLFDTLNTIFYVPSNSKPSKLKIAQNTMEKERGFSTAFLIAMH
jgi:hypothetical protein